MNKKLVKYGNQPANTATKSVTGGNQEKEDFMYYFQQSDKGGK